MPSDPIKLEILYRAAPVVVDRRRGITLRVELVKVLGPPLAIHAAEIAGWLTKLSSSFWAHSWTTFPSLPF